MERRSREPGGEGNYLVWEFLEVIKATALHIDRSGNDYPLLRKFAGALPVEAIPSLTEELMSLRVKVRERAAIGESGWVWGDMEGNFSPADLDPTKLKVKRFGFASLLPNLYEEYPQLAITDFIICLLNECNEALYRQRDLQIKIFSPFPKS